MIIKISASSFNQSQHPVCFGHYLVYVQIPTQVLISGYSLPSSKAELSREKVEIKGCFFVLILIILHFFTLEKTDLKSIKLRKPHW